MIKLIKKCTIKNIKSLYNIDKVNNDGNVIINGIYKTIYKVTPINIINADEDYKNKVYSMYRTFIKNINNIQIIMLIEPKNIQNQIAWYKKRQVFRKMWTMV